MISVSSLLPGEAGHFYWQDKLIQMACGLFVQSIMTLSSPASLYGIIITAAENIWLPEPWDAGFTRTHMHTHKGHKHTHTHKVFTFVFK